MSKTKVVPLRIPENLDDLASLSAREEHTDKATALRQWLHQGAELYALKLVSEGRISIGYAAEALGVTIYDMHRLAETHRVELGPSDEQLQRSHALVESLTRSSMKKSPKSEPDSG